MYYTWHELEINANLFPLTRTSIEKLFLNMGHFNWIICANGYSEVKFFNHTKMKDTTITINNECIKIFYAINVTCNHVAKMGTYISEYSYKDLPTSYHIK